ncbi:hypothetical protein HQQ81_18115 [Microbacteriaceae bacterium VKM Ac-2854]|nr:hypothetical protein [Microbacteriaceae bacterium VKM Ac-2854]
MNPRPRTRLKLFVAAAATAVLVAMSPLSASAATATVGTLPWQAVGSTTTFRACSSIGSTSVSVRATATHNASSTLALTRLSASLQYTSGGPRIKESATTSWKSSSATTTVTAPKGSVLRIALTAKSAGPGVSVPPKSAYRLSNTANPFYGDPFLIAPATLPRC